VKPFALFLILGSSLSALSTPISALGQNTGPERTSASERFKQLTDPEGLEKVLDKAAKDKLRAPYEFFRSQVAPFDVLPYVKANHWSTLSLELRANLAGYDGYLRSAPVKLLDMPHAIAYRRDARLMQDQTQRLSLQLMFPTVFKELSVELTRPEAIRADVLWAAPLMKLDAHQMLVPILSQDPNLYANWSKLNALVPSSGDKDVSAIDKQRYYRTVLPQTPEKPSLSSHPLTWTAISHVIWDDYGPELLNSGQQQALVDWLHWGGQLVIVSSVGSSLAPLQESFLGPYLPATSSGKNVPLIGDDLEVLSQAYPPPLWPGEYQEMLEQTGQGIQAVTDFTPPRYKGPQPIKTPLNRPVLLTGLTPAPGSTSIYLNGEGSPILGVEWRVGRGRVLIVSFRPTDPSLVAWGGFDTLIRRIVMRRPEETWGSTSDRHGRAYAFLNAPSLSWFRLLGRDLNAAPPPEASGAAPGEIATPQDPVAAWIDTSPAGLPVSARKALEVASGITIPPHNFVLRVMLAYIVALVPLNWLVCRYLLRKRELAWVVVPVLALGFSVGVERLAAHDLGYDFACDEIDLVEMQGGYAKAHVNRFVALYSTGRVRSTISFPSDPSALALPMNMQRSLPGEEVVESVWQSSPIPALVDFPIQPRSLAMVRAEQFAPLRGGIRLETENGVRRVVNESELELRDAVLIDTAKDESIELGAIAPGSVAVVSPKGLPAPESTAKKVDWIDVAPFLKQMQDYRWKGPEDRGEFRLVAWTPGPMPGQKIDPPVDRPRGFRIVVAHLEYGAPPNPTAKPYFTPQSKPDDKRAEAPEITKAKNQ
jgi:hypothetical protein